MVFHVIRLLTFFDGMTLMELANRTDEGIDTLKHIFLNIGVLLEIPI